MVNEFNNLLEEELTASSVSVGQVVEGTVVQINEDGVYVNIGAKSEGHLELDQITDDELRRLQIGDRIKVKVVKHSDGEFKLSKKSVDFDEAWNKLQEDQAENREIDITVTEKVKNGYMALAYGVLDGFIHHTNFRGRPNNGQVYKANVLDLNRKARKLVFTRRDIMQREETEALERDYGQLLEGMVVEGIVERLSPYGAFIKITNNVTGLLHISEFSYEHVKKPSEVLKPGETVQVKILGIDREKNKVSLSRKQAMKDPLMLMLPGEELDGVVESVADFGVFVRLENGVTGLVHVSELSHKRYNHPSEIVKPGDSLRVKVLRVQPEDRRISLSAKATERDPWSEVYSHFTIGQSVTGPITQLLQSGAVMQLDGNFEAFIPISEMSEERIAAPGDVVKEGDDVAGVVLSIDTAKRRIRVTMRQSEEAVKQGLSGGGSERSSGGGGGYSGRQPEMVSDIRPTAGKVTLGDILAGKLDLTASSQKDKPEAAPAAEAAPAVEAAPEPVSAPEDAPAPDAEAAEQPAAEPAAEDVQGEGAAPQDHSGGPDETGGSDAPTEGVEGAPESQTGV